MQIDFNQAIVILHYHLRSLILQMCIPFEGILAQPEQISITCMRQTTAGYLYKLPPTVVAAAFHHLRMMNIARKQYNLNAWMYSPIDCIINPLYLLSMPVFRVEQAVIYHKLDPAGDQYQIQITILLQNLLVPSPLGFRHCTFRGFVIPHIEYNQ